MTGIALPQYKTDVPSSAVPRSTKAVSTVLPVVTFLQLELIIPWMRRWNRRNTKANLNPNNPKLGLWQHGLYSPIIQLDMTAQGLCREPLNR
ncbi:hypothetical protein PABG_11707 [Paracoccidioides brasiliensis Pb03]|nr:hypothetical protein PABG_11707 [Paracoccidioides brasiliensis Pb03]